MFQQLKRLGTDTAIYGVSTILGRFLNFLLVPFYTNVLAPGDYGIVTYVYSIIALVTVLYSYGMESAYFKYSSTLEIGTPEQNFGTPFTSLFVSSCVFTGAIVLFAAPIGSVLHVPHRYDSVVLWAAGILALDAMAIIPFAVLRMERKAKAFAFIKFVNILTNVVMNIVLLVVLKTGVQGIFVSGFTASLLTILLLLPTIVRHFNFGLNPGLLRGLLKFGLPFIPAGLATMAVQVIDRPILRALTDDATVGIYQANYRLGIFMMLVVSMYDYAWRPFYFSSVKEPHAKQIFARVLTYLVLFMVGVFLVLTFFVEDIVKMNFFGRHLIHPDYWGGLNIVPVVLLGYVFLGISTNLSAGIYIEKKTHYLPPNMFAGAATNVVANYLLIPPLGMLGAAWATLLAYLIMAVLMYIVVQRIYPVRYEFGRIAKIAAATTVVVVLYYVIRLHQADWDIGSLVVVLKFGLLLLFWFSLHVMKFFEKRELRKAKELITGLVKKNSAPPPDGTPAPDERGD